MDYDFDFGSNEAYYPYPTRNPTSSSHFTTNPCYLLGSSVFPIDQLLASTARTPGSIIFPDYPPQDVFFAPIARNLGVTGPSYSSHHELPAVERTVRSKTSHVPSAPYSTAAARSLRPTYDYTQGPNSQMRTVLCRVDSCGAPCTGKERFVRHVEDVHGISSKHNNDYRCTFDDCVHLAGGKDALVTHMRAAHRISMTKDHITEAVTMVRCPWHGCGKMYTGSSIQRHVATHANTTFRCPICPTNRRFARVPAYQKHFREDHREELVAGRYWYIEEAARH